MTRRKKLIFAFLAVALASGMTTAMLLAVDIYLHGRYERSAGYNVWGYRGPHVGSRRPGEIRMAMLGGSTAFGYGVSWEESIPAQLEQRLTSPQRPVTVVNLAYNNEGAYSLRFTLEDYEWLDLDIALLYDGYNDVTMTAPDANTQVFRRDSPVFRLTGYLPIFPIIFKEKAAALRSGGDPSAAYSGDKPVFRPGLAARGAAGVLSVTAGVGEALGRQVNTVSSPSHQDGPSGAADCERTWTLYCASVAKAIDVALAQGVAVMFVGQPELHARHAQQQQQVAGMIARRYAGNARVTYVSMAQAVNLADQQLSFDGMHLTADGNKRLAERLAVEVLQFAPLQAQ